MNINYHIRHLGITSFEDTWQQMKDYTENRTTDSPDEFWLVQHHPVFTLGLSGKEEHLLFKNHTIPIIRTDRGGQVTYHGIGQVVIYVLLDLKRLGLSIRELVIQLEQGIINYLSTQKIEAYGDRSAPGVYVKQKKIASMGLKVRKGCTYHGISFNVDMDLTPFNYINVCGYSGLQVTQLKEYCNYIDIEQTATQLATFLSRQIYGTN